MIIGTNAENGCYNILVKRGAIDDDGAFSAFAKNEKTLIVTDDGVPEDYIRRISAHFKDPVLIALPQGEKSKNTENYLFLLRTMLHGGFTRHDGVVAAGGGMVEEIPQWLKNISIFLIFMTTVLNLIPEKEDKKPVQFFLGIVMVLIFFQPVLKAGGLEQKMAQTLDRLTLEEEAAAMENVQIRAESFEKQYYVGAWEKETERQIRMYLSESGIPGAAVSVTLEPGNTGEAKEIRIEAPMRQTSIYREEQKKQREMLDEKLTEIKSVLSEVYGTDPAHIMVEISE